MFNEPKPEPAAQPEQPEEVVSDEVAEPSDEKGAYNKYKKKEARFNTASRKWKGANEKFDKLAKEVEAVQEVLERSKQKAAEAKQRCEERLSKMHSAESALDEVKKLQKSLVAASSSSSVPVAEKTSNKEETD